MTRPAMRQRFQGLVATLAILLLVVGTPLVLITIGAAPWDAEVGELRTLLSSPDDGTLALAVIAAVAWIAWLVVAASAVVETVARVRGLPVPSLPGLALPQRAVGQLVAVAALLFIAAPTVLATFPTPPAHATVATSVPETPNIAVIELAPVLTEAAPVLVAANTSNAGQPTINYTVKRGDSLWRIADRLLGDGARYTEIVELNHDVLSGRPDFIVAGTVLKVPHEATEIDGDREAADYVVKPGDTLSEIAEAELGDPLRYPELFEASHDTVQPDGGILTDPDLIRPGWEVTIPGQEKHKVEVEVTPPVVAEPSPGVPIVEPPPTPAPEPAPVVTTDGDADDEVDACAPGWLLPGLTGSGAVLAGLVLLAVRAHRNTQLRYRRPGQTIAPPPPDLRAVEKSAFLSGAPLTASVEQLDRALRHLAAICEDEERAVPSIITVTLLRGTATLHLADEAELPKPWTGEGREWSIRLTATLPDRDIIAPYPLLVAVGQDDADGLHLMNLEHLGVVSLTGDPTAASALARHIAAELALNPWSVLVDVDVIGVGEELASMDTLRLRHHTEGERVLATITRSLEEARDAGWDDPDPYRVVITIHGGTDNLAAVLSSAALRLGAALVAVDVEHIPGSTVVELTVEGRLRSPVLGLDLVAAGLTREEAAACAAIVDLTRDSEPMDIAPFEQAADGWRALADHAGALREELTDVREAGPAGDGSLLPHPAAEYVAVAATTPEDIETLAPVVPEQVRRTVEGADPRLDEDVAAWFDPESRRPRLILLAPVNARAYGVVAPAITKRKPYFVEMLAFLALHPEGTTGSAVADAFSVAGSRARTDLGTLRGWLGDDPATGKAHLPQATKSPAFLETGVRTYQVEGVLADVDLFRRLRLRGQSRGADGVEDLKTAMQLVHGVPFSNLRDKGWSWLLDGERLHETIGCAIVDTAHVIVIDALTTGDLTAARYAAETACKAAPYDDICRLDLVKVAASEGRGEAADRMLTDDVFNRTDDYLPPIELPKRTGEVVGGQRWGNAKGRAKN